MDEVPALTHEMQEWSDRFSDQAKEAYRQKTRLQRFPTVEVRTKTPVLPLDFCVLAELRT